MPLLATPVIALALAGCGGQASPGTGGTTGPASTSTSTSTSKVGGSTELTGIGTVLQTPRGQPMLCLGGVADSLPPQCSGPPVVGWDWAKAPASQSAIGVRWGSYAVVGRWDGTRFTLTRPATTPEAFDGLVHKTPRPPDLTTPCPTPVGGWRVVDPAKATDSAFASTADNAPRLPGYAGLWIDQPLPTSEPAVNDPTTFILNVKVTGDPSEAEDALRRTWGGKLCVSRARHTEAELLRIQNAVAGLPGLLSSGPDLIAERVDLVVLFDDGTLQRTLDARYPGGLVTVSSALYPYEKR